MSRCRLELADELSQFDVATVHGQGWLRLRNGVLLRAAVSAAADELANTPTICRKSYVHESVVTAFEQGALERFSTSLKRARSPIRRARVLAKIIAAMGQPPSSESQRQSARAP